MPTEDISMTMNILPGTFAGLTAAAAGMNQIVGLVNTLGNRVGQTTSVLDSMLVTFSAGIAYAGFQAASAAGEFERSMKMVKAVSGQSSAEIDVLSQKATQFSIKFKLGIEDITNGLQTLGRAGLGSLDTQVSVLETGLTAAKLSGLELSKVLEDIVQTTSLLGGDITSVSFGKQADALTNKILSTSMTAPINMNDVVQTLSYSGGTAAAAGINIENEDALYDYLGTISAFARKGVTGSMAGTALRAFFTKPASQDESVKGAFESLGIQAEDLWKNNGQQMRNVSEQIQIIHDAMAKKHMSTLDQIETWGKIVGNKMGQQMMKLDENNIRSVTNEIRESESATKLAGQTMQNFASDLETINQIGQAMWRDFGNSALTVLRPIVSSIKAILSLLSSDVGWAGTIFGQLMAGGIIVVISQTIGRLGNAMRLIRSIGGELSNQIRHHERTKAAIADEYNRQLDVYKTMGLTDKQSRNLAKTLSQGGFNIKFMSKAMIEFLAKLNEAVALMKELAASMEALARAPLNQITSGQFNRFYTSQMGSKNLKRVNYNALVPGPAWLGSSSEEIEKLKQSGGLFGVKAASPYHSDFTQLSTNTKLPQAFLEQLYSGTVSEEFQKRFGMSSADPFGKWLQQNPHMIHIKDVKIGEGADAVIAKAAMVPMTSLATFLDQKGLGQSTGHHQVGKSTPKTQLSDSKDTPKKTSDTPQSQSAAKTIPTIQSKSEASLKDLTSLQLMQSYNKKSKELQSMSDALNKGDMSGQARAIDLANSLAKTRKELESRNITLIDEALKNQTSTAKTITEQAAKEQTDTIKKAHDKTAKEQTETVKNAHDEAAKEQIRTVKSVYDKAATEQFAKVFGGKMQFGAPTSEQLTNAFTRRYGVTPQEYDSMRANNFTSAQLAGMSAAIPGLRQSSTEFSLEKAAHLRRRQEAEAELADTRKQLRTLRSELVYTPQGLQKAEKFAGDRGYAELMFKNLGLKSVSEQYISDMKRLSQVSKQVADNAKNLDFTKAGYVRDPQTLYAQEYNELRKRYRRDGTLNKSWGARDISRFSASQNQIVNENQELLKRYQIEKQLLEADKKRHSTIEILDKREKELSVTVQEEQKQINILTTNIQSTTKALQQFTTALQHPQNQKVLANMNNAQARADHDAAVNARKNNKMAIDRQKISDTIAQEKEQEKIEKEQAERQRIADEKQRAIDEKNRERQEALSRRMGLTKNTYTQDLANKMLADKEAEDAKLIQAMNNRLRPSKYQPIDKSPVSQNLSSEAMKRFLKTADPLYLEKRNQTQNAYTNFGKLLDKANKEEQRAYPGREKSIQNIYTNFGRLLNKADEEAKRAIPSPTYFDKLVDEKIKNRNAPYRQALDDIEMIKRAQYPGSMPGALDIDRNKGLRLASRQATDKDNLGLRYLTGRIKTFFRETGRAWEGDTKAIENENFGPKLNRTLTQRILSPIANSNFGQRLTKAFNQSAFGRNIGTPQEINQAQKEQLKLRDSLNQAQKQFGVTIPPQFLRGGVGDFDKIKADRSGFKQWATQGGMLRFLNLPQLKTSLDTAKQQWQAGGKKAAIGTGIGGALGSISMLFGPLEAITMAISIGNMLYQKGLEEYNNKLTKIESKLSEANDKYDKAQEAFLSAYSENKDDIAESQKKIQSSWDKYQSKRNIGEKTDITATAAKGTQFVGGSRRVENALITIAQARETGSIKNLDDTTMKMHEELLKVRSSVDDLAEHQSNAFYGTQGYFTNFWDGWDAFWNMGGANDDMTILKNSTEDMQGAAQLMAATIQTTGDVLAPLSEGGLIENKLNSDMLYGRSTWSEDDLNDFMSDDEIDKKNWSWGVRVRHNVQGFYGPGPEAYNKYTQDIGKLDAKTQNKMIIALNKNNKDFKYLGKLLAHENANTSRIRNYLTGLGLKTGLNSIQLKQAAIMQAVYDMKEVAQNNILPSMQDIMLSGYQTAMAGGATAQYSAGSVSAEQAIYSAASMIATNTAILADNYITEQAQKDAESAMGPFGKLMSYGWVANASGSNGFDKTLVEAMGVNTGEIKRIENARLEALWLAGHPGRTEIDAKTAVEKMRKDMSAGKTSQGGVAITNFADQNKYMENTLLKGIKFTAQNQLLDQWLNGADNTDDGSGGGSGSGTSDKDKDTSNRKNWVNLAICNKKEIPKLNVNLFKKPPNFTILNRNFKLRDVNVNTADDAKSIQNAVKNSIIEIQNRSNPKIIQDDAAEYDPVNATEGNTLPVGTKKTE